MTPPTQKLFEFLEREREAEQWQARRRTWLHRWFRAACVGAALIACSIVVYSTPRGRQVVRLAGQYVETTFLKLEEDSLQVRMAELEKEWRGIWEAEFLSNREDSIERYRGYFQSQPKSVRALLAAGGMGPPGSPGGAIVIQNNTSWASVASSQVFITHPRLSYTFRPNQTSFWLNLSLGDLAGYEREGAASLLLPDTDQVRTAMTRANLQAIEASTQTTNSWGLRGSEPDLGADTRIMVVGDSFIQGMMVSDESTPPSQLKHTLAEQHGLSIDVLNCGVLGYGLPEYLGMIREFSARYQPHLIVLSVCSNDFGTRGSEVVNGGGDNWEQSAFFMERIKFTCRSLGVPLIVVPVTEWSILHKVPFGRSYHDRLMSSFKLGQSEIVTITGELVDVDRQGFQVPLRSCDGLNCPLYAPDGTHYSAKATRVWGQVVARRVMTVLSRFGTAARALN